MDKDFKDNMQEYFYHERLKERNELSRIEILEKQIEEFETFIKYLNFYIDEI